VQQEDDWMHDPFGAEIVDGMLYGRGSSDMKCALACMALACSFFAEDTGKDFGGRICVAGIVHEECFEGIASRAVSEALRPDLVVIGESSDLKLKIGQRGRAEILLETFGVPAHSSNPDNGVNAVYAMCRAVDRIRSMKPPVHAFLGKGILELTDIRSLPYPGKSVVPEYCATTWDRRLLVDETKESVLEPIQKILDELKEEDPSFQGRVSYARGDEICYTGEVIGAERFFPAWLLDEDHPAVRKVLGCFRSHGFDTEVTKYSFCTNASHYCGEAGIPVLGMGPSTESMAHTIDEHVPVWQLPAVTQIYMWIMETFLS
jgi:putative selenium metabolism hydrolase